MKKLALLLILSTIIQTSVISQGCLPDGITFTSQAEIDSFQTNYPNCSVIDGFVTISGNNITNLNGLNVLTNIGGDLKIRDIDSITSLYGLNNLSAVDGDLRITLLDGINDMTGLENLTNIGGSLTVQSNHSLSNFTGFGNLDSIGGFLGIDFNPSLINLNGFSNLTSIGSYFRVSHNTGLENLTGIDNLNSIEGSLIIRYNDYLNSLSIFNNFTRLGGLMLEHNPLIHNLSGLENIVLIDGGMHIELMNNLTDFSSFENLATVTGSLIIIWNDSLISLTGLDDINPESITSLVIDLNPLLSTCNVQSICDYLSAPNGYVAISGNATGCASQSEVEAECLVKIDHQIKPNIIIYPNPAEKEIRISDNNIIINEIVIYNQLGLEVLHKKDLSNRVDISELVQGIYILELISNGSKTRQKLIIK